MWAAIAHNTKRSYSFFPVMQPCPRIFMKTSENVIATRQKGKFYYNHHFCEIRPQQFPPLDIFRCKLDSLQTNNNYPR